MSAFSFLKVLQWNKPTIHIIEIKISFHFTFILVFVSSSSLSICQQIHMISTAKCTCHVLHALPRCPPSSERSRHLPDVMSTSDSDNLLLWFSWRQTCFKFSDMNSGKMSGLYVWKLLLSPGTSTVTKRTNSSEKGKIKQLCDHFN